MKRRRPGAAQGETLTKIDPNALKPRPTATSQHATGRGRVTTVLNPVLPRLAPPPKPTFFDTGPSNFPEETLGDEGSDEGSDDDGVRPFFSSP